MEFTYESQGTNTYLVYEIKESDKIDTLSLGMLTNNKIVCLAPTYFTQMDTKRYVKYNVSAKVSVKQFFNGAVSKNKLINVLEGIADGLLSAEEYMIDTNSIILDADYIYVDVTQCSVSLICLPIVRSENISNRLAVFFKNIMFSTQFDQSEDCDYVAKIINFLNGSTAFSLAEFKKTLGLAKGDGSLIHDNNSNQQLQQPQSQLQQSQQLQQLQQPKPQYEQTRATDVAQLNMQNPAQNNTYINKGSVQRPTAPQQVSQPNNMNTRPYGQTPMGNPGQPATNSGGEKKMTVMNLLMHYSKENAKIYKEQKAAKKENKQVNSNVPYSVQNMYNSPNNMNVQNMHENNVKTSKQNPNLGFAIPGQPAPAPNNGGMQTSAQQASGPVPSVNNSKKNSKNKSMPNPTLQGYGQTVPSIPNNGYIQPMPSASNNGYGQQMMGAANPGYGAIAGQIEPRKQGGAADFGETTVLNAGNIGETTVLNGGMNNTPVNPYLIRIKNGEKILVNKPVFKIGKERSYVDYFIGDNTAVSRSHANIITHDGNYYIVDTNSTNHTFVNGEKIPSNTEVPIVHGTKIMLGNEGFEFNLH